MKPVDIATLLLLAALWGGSFLFMRIAAPALGPIWLIEIRVLLAGLALLPVLIRAGLLRTVWPNIVPLSVVGIINSAVPFSLYAFASLSLPAGFTSILNGTAPLFGTVVAALWLKERMSPQRSLGFALGFVGVIVLVGWKQPIAADRSFWLSVGAGLFAALLYAIAAPYTKQKLAGVSPLVTTTLSQLTAAVFLLPALPFTRPTALPSATVMLAVLALALFSTAIAYILYFRLIQRIGSTRALTVTYLIPMFAMLWGALVLGEPITLSMGLGCGLVLLGTAIANDMFNRLRQPG